MNITNILVCDDNKDIVSAIEIYLAGEGYHVLAAYDGCEAVCILDEQPVSLVIMDIMMPDLSCPVTFADYSAGFDPCLPGSHSDAAKLME